MIDKQEPISGPWPRKITIYKGTLYGKPSQEAFEVHLSQDFSYNVYALDQSSAYELYKQLAGHFGSGVAEANSTAVDKKVQKAQSYSVTVPEITITVQANSVEEALKLAGDRYSIIKED
jgi:hypothetical protein